MIIKDIVHGEWEIIEDVLIDLINSNALQRLKNISQQCLPIKYNSQAPFSRYDHSVGVMLLLRKLDANIEEQIAGLLHDISHPTFSHLIDWALGDPQKQDHQDNHYVEILVNSDIPSVLKKHGFDPEDFIDVKKFSLLESDIPNLCADRIDYCLRDLCSYGGKSISDEILNHLIVYNHQIVFDSELGAYSFANEYMLLQRFVWGDDTHVAKFHLFADALKIALNKNIISENDFFGIEEGVLMKLENSGEEEILRILSLLRNGLWLRYDGSKDILLKCKFRYIDPPILFGNKLKKVSDVFPIYNEILKIQKKHFGEERFVEVVSR